MIATLVATTPKISMQPLAFQGIMVYESFPQIRDMLLRRFGDDYVLLFARPEENRGDGTIDWYSPVQGESTPLNDLPEEDQALICENIARMANDIRSYAEELIQSREPLKITRGNILKLALHYPDDKALYVIGRQPVVTCWGFAPGTPGVEGTDLVRLAVPKAPKATAQAGPKPVAEERAASIPAPVPSGADRSGCLWSWWWLLPFLPLILIFLLLFCSFGSLPALSGYSLFSVPGLSFLKKDGEMPKQMDDLSAEIASLRAQVEKHAAMCQPAKPVAPVAEQVQPVPPAQEKADELVIPEKAENVDFMEGRWRCSTGLGNQRTGEPVEVVFYFGKDGKGRGIIYEKNDQCEGEARAAIHEGKLHIDLAEQRCGRNGASYYPVTIDCDNATDGSTQCWGTNHDRSTWDARFHKEK